MVDIGGKKYAMLSDDTYLEYIKNGFEPEMVKLFKLVAKDSEVILDIGGNIGCTALLFGGLSKKVYAFEPSPTTFSFLEKNVAKSGLKNVFLQNIGLGADSGEYTLSVSPNNRSGGFVSNLTRASEGHVHEQIVIRSLDDVVASLDLSQIDFIKIDVEGFEGHVIRGASKTLTSFKPVVVMELNHWCLNAFNVHLSPISLICCDPNFLFFSQLTDQAIWICTTRTTATSSCTTIFCTRDIRTY